MGDDKYSKSPRTIVSSSLFPVHLSDLSFGLLNPCSPPLLALSSACVAFDQSGKFISALGASGVADKIALLPVVRQKNVGSFEVSAKRRIRVYSVLAPFIDISDQFNLTSTLFATNSRLHHVESVDIESM